MATYKVKLFGSCTTSLVATVLVRALDEDEAIEKAYKMAYAGEISEENIKRSFDNIDEWDSAEAE